MMWHNSARNILLAMTFAGLWVSGCGSSPKANQVVVNVTGTVSVMIPTQTQTITATVTGATDVSATFDCSYTTTPNPTTATPTPKPSASAECTSANGAVGVLSNIQNTSTTVASTATFTAPAVFPDQTKFPNVTVTITATSNADKKKTGKFSFTFDSGIRIRLSPATATLGTGETKQFLALDFNSNVVPPDQLTWHVTFEVTAKTSSADCTTGSNSCGSIDKTGTYTAPAAVPTAAPASTTAPVNAAGIVTVYAFSNVDNARIAQAAVTVVKAGDITFSGISPTITPQGALQQDIFLAATNATSQIGVTLFPADSNCVVPTGTQGKTLDPSQLKVVFAPGVSSASIGARVRLNTTGHPEILASAGFYQVQVTSSNTSIQVNTNPPNATFCLQVQPARPTIVSTSPDNFQESRLGQTTGLPFVIDGGFFGPANTPTVSANFDGQALITNSSTLAASSARRLTSFLPTPSASGKFAGLFPVSVTYSTSPAPFAAPNPASAFGNIAVIPDYGGSNTASLSTTIALTPSSAPSAIAIDSVLGYAVVTLAGLNTPGTGAISPTINTAGNVQFLNLAGPAPTLAGSFPSQGFLSTGVAVDDQLHIAAVVNYASRNLSILSIPTGTLLATVDLSCVIPQSDPACKTVPEPFPFSVGIDPFTHRAVVAFASTNVGLIVNLDPNFTFNSDKTVPPQCILPGPASAPKYCPIGYVTLGSGANPQAAFEPGARLVYVTPGGAGLLSAVDLSNLSKGSLGIPIASATRASNVVTITTSSAHDLNPGNPGAVLISGMPTGSTNKTDFNGSFSVGAVLDATHFQYSQADKDDTSTCTATCLASSGVPFLTYSISPSIVGIAINPLTRKAVLADANATFSQITYIDPQSQSVSSMSLFAGVTGSGSSGVPELGATTVAFQPFTNTAVTFNPKRNEVSLLDPSALQRLQILPTTGETGTGTASFTPPGTGTTAITVNLFGALAVDSTNNLALAVSSGSSDISVFQLGTIKSVHIERVQTPAIDDSTFATPANLSPAAKITLGAAPKAVGPVKIFGSGFGATPLQVRLDGNDVSTLGATVTLVGNHEIDVTFPATVPGTNPAVPFFSGPHHFALDVVTSAAAGLNSSNVVDFTVVEEIPLAPCNVTTTPPTTSPAAPGGVAIDEVNNLAVVTNTGSGCNQVSVFSLNPANIFNQTVKTIATGATPTGVAVLPSFAYIGQPAGTSGVAVVTNNGSNSASLIDLVNAVQVKDGTTANNPITVNVGTAPSGVAIDQETNLAVVANTSSNTVSTIDLTPIAQDPSNPSKTIGALAPHTVAVDQNPIAVAIDPDRGSNGRGLAVVTCLVLNGASSPFGALDAVDIGAATPIRSSSASTSFLSSTPTGVVFDPSVSLFYAVSTQGNVITAFNPDSGQTQTIKVGINPNAIAYNFQTGSILTVNSLSNTVSVVDSQTFATKATLGIGGTSKFAAAIQTFTNLAVIADQANNRVILFPLPK